MSGNDTPALPRSNHHGVRGLEPAAGDGVGAGRGSGFLSRVRPHDLFEGIGGYPSTVEQAFREAFPSVYAFIRAVNRHEHGELVRRLQRLESWLVVERVAPRLTGRVPCLTLHDAIYSTQGSLAAVENAFAEVFDAIGCRLTLKREAG